MAENSAAFQIESILNPNNKSLDIYLNTNFNNNYNIKLFDSDNPSKVYNGTLVPNSFDSTNKNTKTFLLIGENLIPNKQYSITVTNDNNETSEAYNFSFDSISAIENDASRRDEIRAFRAFISSFLILVATSITSGNLEV